MHPFATRAIWTASMGVTLLGAAFNAPVAAQSLDGLWMSDGYGELAEIHGDSLSVLDHLHKLRAFLDWHAHGQRYRRAGGRLHGRRRFSPLSARGLRRRCARTLRRRCLGYYPAQDLRQAEGL